MNDVPRVTTIDDDLRRRAGIPHPRPFVLETIVAVDDLSDVVPHMNNVRSLHWIDRAAEAHAATVGWSRPALLDAGLMWFVGRHEIDYRAECHVRERLLVCTWVRSAAGVRAWRDTMIVRAEAPGDPVAVRSSTLWVLVELATRRPRRIPRDMMALLDPLDPPDPLESSSPGAIATPSARSHDRCVPR